MKFLCGFWRRQQASTEPLPFPVPHMTSGVQVDEALEILATLEQYHNLHTEFYRGSSPCRICGCMNGSREYSIEFEGDVWIWPQGLRHYIAEHGVALPLELKQLATRMVIARSTPMISRRIIQVIEFKGEQSYIPDEIKVLCEDGTIWHGKYRWTSPDDRRGVWKWMKVDLPDLPPV